MPYMICLLVPAATIELLLITLYIQQEAEMMQTLNCSAKPTEEENYHPKSHCNKKDHEKNILQMNI